jgi:hypothetical protein
MKKKMLFTHTLQQQENLNTVQVVNDKPSCKAEPTARCGTPA